MGAIWTLISLLFLSSGPYTLQGSLPYRRCAASWPGDSRRPPYRRRALSDCRAALVRARRLLI